MGGEAPIPDDLFVITHGGNGGNAGGALVQFQSGTISSSGALGEFVGVMAVANGGSGGGGGQARAGSGSFGGAAGNGGDGGVAVAEIGGGTTISIHTVAQSPDIAQSNPTAGVFVASNGADGGEGGLVGGQLNVKDRGGAGGSGGRGFQASASVLGSITIGTDYPAGNQNVVGGQAVLVQSLGGAGGRGAGAQGSITDEGGDGGSAGAGAALP